MSDSRGLKEKAESFFNKFFDVHKKQSSPPKPTSGVHRPSESVSQLSAIFNGLSVSGPTTPATGQAKTDFIGGFNLASASTPTLSSSSGSQMMPVPCLPPPEQQSLTMQMALNPNYLMRPGYNKPVTSPLPPRTPKRPSRRYSSSSSPAVSATINSVPGPTNNNSASTPSTPSSKHNQVQCAGITKAGKRCTRQVKMSFAGDNGNDDEECIPRFCYQHTDEVLSPTGYYAKKTGNWVSFEDWIPGYLQKPTQASLRAEMEKTRSASDKPGYIYTFEIRDPDVTRTIKLKVGRSYNVIKRIDQWTKQCGSKEQVLRGYYPDPREEGSMMKGRVETGERAAWCHRLERLIHIELADLVSTCVYLEPNWPYNEAVPSVPSATPSKSSGKYKPCPDCGSLHKEIFEFRRWNEGEPNEGMEWEKIVRPVVQRWGMFVDIYV